MERGSGNCFFFSTAKDAPSWIDVGACSRFLHKTQLSNSAKLPKHRFVLVQSDGLMPSGDCLN